MKVICFWVNIFV